MKNERGITLVSLGVIIIVILIITGTAINTSMERFEINNANKMINDLELLKDKISTYYTKYGVLPIASRYTDSPTLIRSVPEEERYNCYIIDLSQLEGISLNYGQKGYENPASRVQEEFTDVYIINTDTHAIYYLKGVKLKDKMYYTIDSSGQLKTDDIPPTTPQIKIISGFYDEYKKFYTTNVEIEINAGKDNWSGIEHTSYTINSEPTVYFTNDKKTFQITQNGVYKIKAKTRDKESNDSQEIELEFEVHSIHDDYYEGFYSPAPTCTEKGVKISTCKYVGQTSGIMCGETKTEELSALGHLEVTDSGHAATCTETGLTGGKHCSRCDAILEDQETIPALGHVEVIEKGYAATCTTKGVTDRIYCSRCNTVLQSKQEIPALGHYLGYGYKNYQDVDIYIQNFYPNQHVRYEKCTRCDYLEYYENVIEWCYPSKLDIIGYYLNDAIRSVQCEACAATMYTYSFTLYGIFWTENKYNTYCFELENNDARRDWFYQKFWKEYYGFDSYY